MKKLNKVAMLFASAALAAPLTVFAQAKPVDNWRSGTGQIVAVDVADNSTKVNMSRVTWADDNANFTVTTGLARVELYRADPKEDPWLRLVASNGSSCYLHLDGSM